MNFRKVVNSVPLGKQSRNPGVEVNGYVDPHAHLFRRRPHTIREKPSWRGERLFMVTPIEVEVGDPHRRRAGLGEIWRAAVMAAGLGNTRDAARFLK